MNRWDERLLGAVRRSPGGPVMRCAGQGIDAWFMGSLPRITWDSHSPALLINGLTVVVPQALQGGVLPPDGDRAGDSYA